MKIEQFVLTPFQQNTRVISCDVTGEAICVDPGEPSPAVADFIDENSLVLKAVCLTHGHLDHIGGTAFLHERFPDAEIIAHRDELPLYSSLPLQPVMIGFRPDQLDELGMSYDPPPDITRYVDSGDLISVGTLEFEVRHCPGHTPGHIVLVELSERLVITGDCLFNGTIGRTDLPGGDFEQLIESINGQIMTLADDYRVFCGHGPETTVGRERTSNPFLTGLYKP